MRAFLVFLIFMLCSSVAWGVHDSELDEVYRDTLIIPPELRKNNNGVDSMPDSLPYEPSRTPVEVDFLAMFDAE